LEEKDPKSSSGSLEDLGSFSSNDPNIWEDRKSFPFDTSFHTVNSLAPSFLALPPPRALPADDLIGDNDDEHDNSAVAKEEKLDDDDGFLVTLPEEAYLPEDATVVRCFSWDRFRLMTPPPPAGIIRMRFSKEYYVNFLRTRGTIYIKKISNLPVDLWNLKIFFFR
jgi:hypothetical protein